MTMMAPTSPDRRRRRQQNGGGGVSELKIQDFNQV